MSLRRGIFALAAWALVLGLAAAAPAAILFEDDFSAGAIDTAKWNVQVDAGCSIGVVAGTLQAEFTGADAARGAYVVSKPIALPAEWTSISVTGQWAFTTPGLGECDMLIYNADDQTKYLRVTYLNWPSDHFRRAQTDASVDDYSHTTFPSSLTPFQWTFTPAGWTFAEDGATFVDWSTTLMAGTQNILLKIGGWEYSAVYNADRFDNIQVTPEPATLSLLALGGLGALLRRKK